MNKTILLVLFFIVLSFGFQIKPKAFADTTVSFSVFYSSLTPYGHWVFIQPYGYVWYPVNVEYGWMPYVNGYWVWSEYGWTWVSYESWGWATYHYGRWIYDDYYGWVWIPGTVWGPAWVVWYRGPEYIGWTPRPPGQRFFREIGVTELHYNTYIPPQRCVFVRGRDFLNPHINAVIAPRVNNTEIIKTTTPITRIKTSHGHIFNEGPGIRYIEKYTGSRVKRFNIVQRNININEIVHNQRQINKVQEHTYYVYRPSITRIPKEAPEVVYRRGHGPANTYNNVNNQQMHQGNPQEYNQYPARGTRNSGVYERIGPPGQGYNNADDNRGRGRGKARGRMDRNQDN